MRENSDDLRDFLSKYTERLIELYNRHDPRNPSKEYDKTNDAYLAIDLCWRIFDKAGHWAQRHLIGIEYANELCEEIAELELFKDLYDENYSFLDDHPFLEILPLIEEGWNFAALNWADYDFLEKFEEIREVTPLSRTGKRNYIYELFTSTSPGSYYWRNELGHALKALNDGTTLDLFKKNDVKGQGLTYEARIWKLQALIFANFLIGKGDSKTGALTQVADGIGRSYETLRDWDSAIRFDSWSLFQLSAARIAGEFEKELKAMRGIYDTPDPKLAKRNKRYKNTNLVELAYHYVHGASRYELSAIRDCLNRSLSGDQVSPKAE